MSPVLSQHATADPAPCWDAIPPRIASPAGPPPACRWLRPSVPHFHLWHTIDSTPPLLHHSFFPACHLSSQPGPASACDVHQADLQPAAQDPHVPYRPPCLSNLPAQAPTTTRRERRAATATAERAPTPRPQRGPEPRCSACWRSTSSSTTRTWWAASPRASGGRSGRGPGVGMRRNGILWEGAFSCCQGGAKRSGHSPGGGCCRRQLLS